MIFSNLSCVRILICFRRWIYAFLLGNNHMHVEYIFYIYPNSFGVADTDCLSADSSMPQKLHIIGLLYGFFFSNI